MNNSFRPTSPKNRIELLDILRGFAIVGVLLSNIMLFSGYLFTPFADLNKMHWAEFNDILSIVVSVIISGKFYPILMILFGAGLYMQFSKSREDGFIKFFIWRMFLLFLIGAIHLTFWAGDVVSVYAIFALLLIPIRYLKPKSYLVIAIIMFLLHFITGYIQSAFLTPASTNNIERIARFQLAGVSPSELISTVQNDGFAGLRFITDKQANFLWTIVRYIRVIPDTIFLFMLGGYLFGSGFFTEKVHKVKYLLIFLGIGIVGSFLLNYVSYSFKIVDNTFLGLAYISLIAIIIRSLKGKKVLSLLVPLGRMALTNYIMQSIICIAIFYGVGLGYFGKMPLYQVYLVGFFILIFQLWFSTLWLQKYRFGPLEMVWRRLSYGKRINKQTK